uniref:Sosondowah ankyrin repeat domain family member B n=1 Tax=Sphenodon punctatus TaxID=8508 RepID=A0A8D0GM74_SPHPU
MARELSQEALLDFLCQAGGRVANAALLGHFKRFLRDPAAPPEQLHRHRELFKGFVNSVATVKQEEPGGPKYVVLKKRYRDLLGEEEELSRPPAAPTDTEKSSQPRRGEPLEENPGAAPVAGGSGGQEGPRVGAECAARTPGGPCWECRTALTCLASEQSPPRRDHPRPSRPGGTGAPGRRMVPLPSAAAGALESEAPPLPLPAPERCRPEEEPALRRGLLSPQHGAPEGADGPWQAMGAPPSTRLLQRTREWVERNHEGGCCLPGPPPQEGSLSSASGGCPSLPSSRSPTPLAPEDAWRGYLPIFRSIRCQLSLHDLEDFIEQGSQEGSSSSERSECSRGCGGRRAAGRTGGAGGQKGQDWDSGCPLPQTNGWAERRAPQANGPAAAPCAQESAPQLSTSAPTAAARGRRSFRLRRSSAGLSSSEDELERDPGTKCRRRPRAKKGEKGPSLPAPSLDAPLALALQRVPPSQSKQSPRASDPDAEDLEPRPSLVPLEPREHDWIVKLASGSWVQVLALLFQDPQLALRRDFISGYTALHWIAKHGDSQALQDFAAGATKAGVSLDVNVKSSCGYTPLHLAAIHGHQAVIQVLVQKLHSRVHVRDSSGKRPWQYLGSATSGEVWQLLGAPKGQTIFPARPIRSASPAARKAKSQEVVRGISRKASLAACLKAQHARWKTGNRYPALRARAEHSD